MFRIGTLIVFAALAAAGCATSGAVGHPVPRPFPTPSSSAPARPEAAPAPTGPAAAYAITGTALSLRGVPYRNGGGDPASGFDCSGFVWYVFSQHGIGVPRTVVEQFQIGTRVDAGPLDPGDLVFFDTKGGGATHVGILIGGDEFVHAPSSSSGVRVERLGSPYWAARYVGARRVL